MQGLFFFNTKIQNLGSVWGSFTVQVFITYSCIAILDSNSNPEKIDFPIPGNDDARRAIDLYCTLIKETIISAKSSIPAQTVSKNRK